MPLYKKKPVVVEARQMPVGPGNNVEAHDIYKWVEDNTQGSYDPESPERPASGVTIDPATGFMVIATLEGEMQVKPGDYVIKGVNGEFYPCKPDIFEKTYELDEWDFNEIALPEDIMNDQMFLQYTGKQLGEVCVACKVTENNFNWLAKMTKATVVKDQPWSDPRLEFGRGNNAEYGDYVINGGSGIFRPLEAEIFEDNYER